MSEEGNETEGQAAETTETDVKDWEAEAKKWQALSQKMEQRAKGNADAAKELEKFRKAEADRAEAEKSEAEKRTAAEKRAEEAELRALRLEVATDKGLPPKLAKRLVGATREELEADADELLSDAPPARKEPEKPKAPKPDKSQGARDGARLPAAERAQKRLERLGFAKPAS